MEAEKGADVVVKDKVEVIGLSIASCLNRASAFLNKDLSVLDYEIIERGRKSFFKSEPYRIEVSLLPEQSQYEGLEEFSMKLGVGDRLMSDELDQFVTPKHLDGSVLIRSYRTGIFLKVNPPIGDGDPISEDEVNARFQHMGISNFDAAKVQQLVKQQSGEAIKVGKYVPKPEADSSVKIEISPDEMKAYMKVSSPKPGGRHLELVDVVTALKAHGVVIGFKEDDIKKALEEDLYMQEVLVAEGQPVQHGKDASIDYKVKIRKDIQLEEDAKGKIDFKQMNLVENVVVGQVLAEKIPATRGKVGRTLKNEIVQARDGKDNPLTQGKGTILSDDGSRLIAEINGQVVYSNNRISVEPVYRVVGDVGPKTGNIMFLGSVVIGGNVLDNYEVKAAGNIEVSGAVQKAKLEAEGDIVVRSGVQGAMIESTGGSLIGKFIQNAEIKVATDVIAGEGILHSNVEAGGKVHCNGRRAQIVGGNIRATKEIRARMVGSQAYTATEIHVGTDPRLLAQHEELVKLQSDNEEKLTRTGKTLATLKARKEADPDGFDDSQEEELAKNEKAIAKMNKKKSDFAEEIQKLDEVMNEMSAEGKVHVEKELFPGVVITIKDANQSIADSYKQVTVSYDNGYVKIDKLEKDADSKKRSWRK